MPIAATAGGKASTTSAAASLALSTFNLVVGQDVYVVVALDSTSSSVTGITDNATTPNTYTFILAKNGTGIRVEIWKSHIATAKTGATLTISASPNCNIGGAAEEYSGVSAEGNTASDSGTITNASLDVMTQDGNNWTVVGFAFNSQSGDSLTAVLGTSRQSSIPAATAAGVALYDNTMVADGTLECATKISTARNWAVAGVELRSGGPSITVKDYAETTAPDIQGEAVLAYGNFTYCNVLMPTGLALAPSSFVPVPVAQDLKGGVTGTAYSETISAQGGTSPYTFSVISGALPTGLSMSSSGAITGTPSAAATYNFTVKVTDANGYTGTQAFEIIISAAPTPPNFGYIA